MPPPTERSSLDSLPAGGAPALTRARRLRRRVAGRTLRGSFRRSLWLGWAIVAVLPLRWFPVTVATVVQLLVGVAAITLVDLALAATRVELRLHLQRRVAKAATPARRDAQPLLLSTRWYQRWGGLVVALCFSWALLMADVDWGDTLLERAASFTIAALFGLLCLAPVVKLLHPSLRLALSTRELAPGAPLGIRWQFTRPFRVRRCRMLLEARVDDGEFSSLVQTLPLLDTTGTSQAGLGRCNVSLPDGLSRSGARRKGGVVCWRLLIVGELAWGFEFQEAFPITVRRREGPVPAAGPHRPGLLHRSA